MARRKSRRDDQNILAMLLDAPWQLSVFSAFVVFVVMRWGAPAVLHSPALTPLGIMISSFATLAASGLLVVALISYFSNKKQSASPETVTAKRLDNSGDNQKNSTNRWGASNVGKHTAAKQSSEPLIKSSTTDWGLFTGRAAAQKVQPTEWSIELLRKLEWNRFEKLCAEYFKLLGKRVETVTHGADGGIDARIYANNSNVLECAIQCKAWSRVVGVQSVRELLGVMVHESAGKGIFMTTSTFSDDAKKFAADHSDKLFLIEGQKFISMIQKLPEEKGAKLLAFATEGDYTTPTCASCGVKMVWRTKGNFWGCKNFPKCKTTLRVAAA